MPLKLLFSGQLLSTGKGRKKRTLVMGTSLQSATTGDSRLLLYLSLEASSCEDVHQKKDSFNSEEHFAAVYAINAPLTDNKAIRIKVEQFDELIAVRRSSTDIGKSRGPTSSFATGRRLTTTCSNVQIRFGLVT